MKILIGVIGLATVACLMSGCATTGTGGVVSIGPDLYMIGGLDKFTDFSSSGAKARLYQQGSKYCSDLGRVLQPVNSTGHDSGPYTYASAEIQFRCLLPTDPRLSQ